jgi:hypothetical protein
MFTSSFKKMFQKRYKAGSRHSNGDRLKWPQTSVADPWHFEEDPDPDLDPRIHASDKWIRIQEAQKHCGSGSAILPPTDPVVVLIANNSDDALRQRRLLGLLGQLDEGPALLLLDKSSDQSGTVLLSSYQPVPFLHQRTLWCKKLPSLWVFSVFFLFFCKGSAGKVLLLRSPLRYFKKSAGCSSTQHATLVNFTFQLSKLIIQ